MKYVETPIIIHINNCVFHKDTFSQGLNFNTSSRASMVAAAVALRFVAVFSARVGVPQRVIEAIGISVICLRVLFVLDNDVDREHAADERVVQAAVHVYQTEVIVVLVQGVTAVERGGGVICVKLDIHFFSFNSTTDSMRSPVLSSTTYMYSAGTKHQREGD